MNNMRPHNAHYGSETEVALTTAVRITDIMRRGGETVVSLIQNMMQENRATSVSKSKGGQGPDVKGVMIGSQDVKNINARQLARA